MRPPEDRGDEACNDSGDQAGGRSDARTDTEGKGKRECDNADRDTGDDVGLPRTT
ncbi:Uncharacterised protein [Mycobacteroides abscessus subsp. abscessus]|nr:Uncharacterised protein [Mycobacteroides abscessus subsp. abscessus]